MTVMICQNVPYVFCFEKTDCIKDEDEEYFSIARVFIIIVNNTGYYYTRNNLSNPWNFNDAEKLQRFIDYSKQAFNAKGFELKEEGLYDASSCIRSENFIWKPQEDKEWDIL